MIVKFAVGGVGYPRDSQGGAICTPNSLFPDSVCPPVLETKTLTTDWRQFSILLPGNRDYSKVVGGFGLLMETPGVIYLDDIAYDFSP
jgi:hypothetical protein